MSANTYGRQVVVPLMNKSGGGVIAGDVVIIDTTNDAAFTTTTSGGYTGFVGIAQETIAANATGRVLTAGYAALVNVNASVTRGYFGATHTVAKQAASAGASRVVGVFCQFLTAGTTPTAHVLGFPDASSASGNVATDAIWDAAGDTVVASGANTAVKRVNNDGTTVAPTVNEDSGDGYAIGSRWLDTTADKEYVCLDATVGAAVWRLTTQLLARTEATLGGDVTLTSAGTYYDGPTITPVAGTYDVWGRITFITGGTGNRGFTGRLIANASATPIDEAETDAPSASGNQYQLILSARVVADGTNPILIRGSSATATVDKMSRDPQSNSPSSIHRATLLVITRVA